MKRRIMAFIAVLVAFVMSFALIACNGNTNTPGGNTPGGNTPGGNTPGGNTPGGNTPGGNTPGGNTPGTEDKSAVKRAVDAVNELLAEKGFTATFEHTEGTKAYPGEQATGDIVFDGSKAKLTSAGGTVIADLATGYTYTFGDGNVLVDYDTALPAGLFEHALNVFSTELDGLQITDEQWATAEAAVTYDKATDTLTYKLDLANAINALTAPLYKAYKQDKSVMWLVDEYLLEASDGNMQFSPTEAEGVVSISNLIAGYAEMFPTQTIGELFETLKAVGLDIDAILAANDMTFEQLFAMLEIEMTEAQFKARTIEDTIVGAYKAVMEMMGSTEPDAPVEGNTPAPAAEGETGDPEQGGGESQPGMSEMLMPMLMAALNGALTGEKTDNDPTAKKVVGDVITTVVELAEAQKVKTLVDEMIAPNEPSVAFAIQEQIQMREVSCEIQVKLDGDKLDWIKVVGKFEHAYTPQAVEGDGMTALTFFDDNEYVFDVKLDFTSISSDTSVTFDRGTAVFGTDITIGDAIVVGDIAEDLEMYIELGNRDVTVAVGDYSTSDSGPEVVANPGITYDAATHTVTVSKELLSAYFAENEGAVFQMGVRVDYPSDNDGIIPAYWPVNIIHFPAASEGVGGFVQALLDAVALMW